MKKITLQILITIFFTITLTSCLTYSNVKKSLKMTDANRNDGKITYVFEHYAWRSPIVNLDSTKLEAREKCISWGYQDVEFYEPSRDCLDFDSDGDCDLWKVTYNCQCIK